MAILFRIFALLLLGLGVWWLASCYSDGVPPTTATLERIQGRLDAAAARQDFKGTVEEANQALAIAPLEWTYYFRRASGEAFSSDGVEAAVRDFDTARFLAPNWIELCFDEGEVWLAANNPHHCLDAWYEALDRAGEQAVPTYSRMLDHAVLYPEIHRGLREKASTNLDYLLTFLRHATPEEFQDEIRGLLASDPDLRTLSSPQQKDLFTAWHDHGNQDELASALLQHTEWQVYGWKYLAQHFADRKDFQLACLTALKYLSPPVLPGPSPVPPVGDSKRGVFDVEHDIVAGVRLSQEQIQQGRDDEALATMAELEKSKDCPTYIFYFEAQLHAKKQQWEDAWNALLKYNGG